MAAIPASVRPYVGWDPRIDDPWVKISYERSRDSTANYYPKRTDADTKVFEGQIVLNKATAPFIYSKFTPTKMKVRRGTYPKLDKVVDMLIGDGVGLTDRTKVLKLLLWCRDIPVRGSKSGKRLIGGTEEEVAFGGTDTCNEMNRVFMVLCQIAGFASRYVGHYSWISPDKDLTYHPGHGVAEVFVEGKWAYFDIRGKHFIWPDNTLCSAWDLVSHPDLYIHQPDSVKVLRDLRRNSWDSGQCLIQWPSLQVISNYDAAVRKTCTYSSFKEGAARSKKFRGIAKDLTVKAKAACRELLKNGYKPPA